MDKSDQQCKDVYAHYGLAMFCAQCLEQAIIIQILFLDHMPNAVATFSTKEEWIQNFDKFIGDASTKTMGQLLGKLQKLSIPCDELSQDLKRALKKRNWLAHCYFPERTVEFMNEQGRLEMISELEITQEYFRQVENKVNRITDEVSVKYELTDEVKEKMMTQMLTEIKADI
jgi:hypothetical protein